MGRTTAKIMNNRRGANKMGDAGTGEDDGNEGNETVTGPSVTDGFGFGFGSGFEDSPSTFSDFGDSIGLSGGADTLGDVGVSDVSEAAEAANVPDNMIAAPEPIKEPAPVEEKPVITRGKRRRSILSEEEGGILKGTPVYRRSILGR